MWLLFFMLPWTTPIASDAMGEMIARNFIDHLANRDVDRATALLAAKTNFDGVEITGEEAQKAHLRKILERHPAPIRFLRLHVMTGKQAVERFGTPPARLGPFNPEKSLVALARRKTGGLVMVLEEMDRIPGHWRIVALTD